MRMYVIEHWFEFLLWMGAGLSGVIAVWLVMVIVGEIRRRVLRRRIRREMRIGRHG